MALCASAPPSQARRIRGIELAPSLFPDFHHPSATLRQGVEPDLTSLLAVDGSRPITQRRPRPCSTLNKVADEPIMHPDDVEDLAVAENASKIGGGAGSGGAVRSRERHAQ